MKKLVAVVQKRAYSYTIFEGNLKIRFGQFDAVIRKNGKLYQVVLYQDEKILTAKEFKKPEKALDFIHNNWVVIYNVQVIRQGNSSKFKRLISKISFNRRIKEAKYGKEL